jgi:hypothetical protein
MLLPQKSRSSKQKLCPWLNVSQYSPPSMTWTQEEIARVGADLEIQLTMTNLLLGNT